MSGEVKQRRVAEALAAAIRDGTYAVGDRLPSHAETAQQHEVSVTTARMAAGLLRDLGLVAPRPGGGMVVVAVPDGDLPERRPSSTLAERALTEVAELRARVERLEIRVAALGRRARGTPRRAADPHDGGPVE